MIQWPGPAAWTLQRQRADLLARQRRFDLQFLAALVLGAGLRVEEVDVDLVGADLGRVDVHLQGGRADRRWSTENGPDSAETGGA